MNKYTFQDIGKMIANKALMDRLLLSQMESFIGMPNNIIYYGLLSNECDLISTNQKAFEIMCMMNDNDSDVLINASGKHPYRQIKDVLAYGIAFLMPSIINHIKLHVATNFARQVLDNVSDKTIHNNIDCSQFGMVNDWLEDLLNSRQLSKLNTIEKVERAIEHFDHYIELMHDSIQHDVTHKSSLIDILTHNQNDKNDNFTTANDKKLTC